MECKRCGDCCRLPSIRYTGWWRSEPEYLKLSEQQIQKLEAERAKYPIYPNCCEMLIFKNNLSVCLIEKILGFRPKSCQDYWCEEMKKEGVNEKC